MNARINKLEQHQAESKASVRSYAEVATMPTTNHASSSVSMERIERLEFATSEGEHKRRLLQVKLSHPEIRNNAGDLDKHVRDYLSPKL